MRTQHCLAGFAGLMMVAAMAAPAAAGENGFVQGFGALKLESMSSTDTSLGGVVGGTLTKNLQLVGEAGRMSNILPATVDTFLDFSPIGFGVSAWYGQGGLRFTTDSRSPVRAYAETSAGVARLHTDLNAFETGLPGIINDVALRFLDRTDPIASVGGGLTFGGGNFMADVGYRYRRIFSPDWVSILALGGTLHTSEVRVGVGVRF